MTNAVEAIIKLAEATIGYSQLGKLLSCSSCFHPLRWVLFDGKSNGIGCLLRNNDVKMSPAMS